MVSLILAMPALWLIFHCASEPKEPAFNFARIPEADSRRPQYIDGDDGTQLALYKYDTTSPKSVVLFLHGGGAHANAGYQPLLNELATNASMRIYALDLRGHGRSSGPRGFSSSREQVYQDIGKAIQHIRELNDDLPLILAGHSSGCGLLLNYSEASIARNPTAYVFISPELGYRSDTHRPESGDSFATAHLWVFLLHAFSNRVLCSKCEAVSFNYPPVALESDPLLITGISPEMAHALTPSAPADQIRALKSPVHFFIGENDQLIDTKKLRVYYEQLKPSTNEDSSFTEISGEGHLSILGAGKRISRMIDSRLNIE